MSARQTIRAFLAGQREAQARFLAELVKIPSDNPPGDCRPHAEAAARLLEALGFAVERHPAPEALVRANGMFSCVNLVVRERFGEGGPTIACNAHGDVVPPGLGWTTDPYGAETRDGRMYGRGVAVSKSDFATYAFALMALKQSGARLKGAIELHFTYDEEAGGAIGPKWLLEQGISRPDYAISAGFSYGVTTAHNGCLHLEVQVFGKSGHAAEPQKGHDALEAAALILNDLYAYRKALTALESKIPGIGYPTLVVGLIKGGINTNVVPDHVVFRLDRRIIPDEVPGAAERFLNALIKESVRKMDGIRVEVRRILFADPFVPVPGQERLVDAISRNANAVFGVEVKPHGVPLYTDARHYSEAGIPTVLYGAGPRTLEEANGHRADENLLLDDLYKATEVVALSYMDLLDAREGGRR
ncbi:MAG: M20/M25/M40 family metallo-hydrolase [Betaproteobacteria bacterium]|jgi:acetylornithine deacetylase/succinyl-diaminopimelate desuccinylase-like protein|nr:M20/M25/M40 family metallo-hydrolase [Betaproteobacteria bacterium]